MIAAACSHHQWHISQRHMVTVTVTCVDSHSHGHSFSQEQRPLSALRASVFPSNLYIAIRASSLRMKNVTASRCQSFWTLLRSHTFSQVYFSLRRHGRTHVWMSMALTLTHPNEHVLHLETQTTKTNAHFYHANIQKPLKPLAHIMSEVPKTQNTGSHDWLSWTNSHSLVPGGLGHRARSVSLDLVFSVICFGLQNQDDVRAAVQKFWVVHWRSKGDDHKGGCRVVWWCVYGLLKADIWLPSASPSDDSQHDSISSACSPGPGSRPGSSTLPDAGDPNSVASFGPGFWSVSRLSDAAGPLEGFARRSFHLFRCGVVSLCVCVSIIIS
jgi:hypothetical protein